MAKPSQLDKAIVSELLSELKRIVNGFERCMIYSGTDPEFAALAVASARAVIAKVEGVQ